MIRTSAPRSALVLQGELSRENSQKLSEMSKLKAASDEDHQLFTQLESSLRRVMSSKGVSDEVLARAADAEEVSDWIERGGDGEALPDSISQKMLSRGMSRQAVEELLKKGDDNVAGARAASTAAAPAAVVAEGDGFNVIRVGIVGAGKNTCERHIPLIKLIDGVRITHVANRSLESSQAVAKKFGIPNACSVDELLRSDAVDAVIIGTWPYKHAEYATAALGANKHVLCEARMAMDGIEARTMLAASRAHPELVAQIVPSPYTLELDDGLARYVKEKIGRLVLVRGVCCTDAFAAVEATAPPTWRADRNLSGNNIMSMGIVYEALIRWVGRAATVSALGSTVVAAQGDMPNVLALHGKLRKDDATYQLTFSDASGLGGQNDIWLHGTKATLHIDLAGKRVYFGARGDQTLREITAELKSGPGWNVEKDFVDAIRGERNVTLTDFDTGVHYMSFTDAVWEAMRSGSVATV
jgi:predicted dehydrogenase